MWEAGNLTKNPKKRRISNGEAEEIFFQYLSVADASRTGDREPRWAAMRRRGRRRLPRIVFMVRGRIL